MAAVSGNLALLLDVTSHRMVVADRKIHLTALDVVLNLPKREINFNYPTLAKKSSDSEGETRNHRVVTRGKFNYKFNAVDFDADSSDDDSDGNGEEKYDWEKEMRRRLKELEEMKELEKKAEELQNRAEEDEEEGREDTEEEKRRRVRKELEKVAQEQAERRATAQLMFELGQKAYGRGTYGRAIEFFEGALTIIPRPTLFGGEIQIWLAMAYEANNRHADCIALYKQLETKHPSLSIRRQASELRYILQAPKLKISEEEMVTIPLIGSSYDSYAATWSGKYEERDQTITASATKQPASSRYYFGDFLPWQPPIGWEKNKALWAAVTLWLGLVGAALLLQR